MSNPYARGQLAKALLTAATHEDAAVRERAASRVNAWSRMLDALRSKQIVLGSRVPAAGLPEWVTLEVLRGGFATGAPLAGGALEADEIARADSLNLPHSRAAVFASYLSDEGLAELQTMLAEGTYEVRIPEDAVLLVLGHLAAQEDQDGALALIEAIRPFIDSLRFMPRSAAARTTPPGQVSRRTAGQVREQLAATKTRPQVEAQREALTVWLPLTERFVELWSAAGRPQQPKSGRALWPGASARDSTRDSAWGAQARTLVAEYDHAAAQHRLCGKYRSDKENLFKLVSATRAVLSNQHTEPMLRHVERILASIEAKRPQPARAELRALQAQVGAAPSHRKLGEVAAERCADLRADEGIADPSALLKPVSKAEAEQFGIPAGMAMPPAVGRKVRLGTVGSPTSLIGDGLVPSAEVLAELLPAMTGLQIAAAQPDEASGRLLAALYEAFRRRRSLLLLDYKQQVQFDELPWAAALQARGERPISASVGETARQVAALALDSFPGTILPNPLVQELTTLFERAGTPLPLVPELAADIFEGGFSKRFPEAAHVAAVLLQGTLYERYYGLDFASMLQAPLDKADFGKLCAVEESSNWVAVNGMVIERGQLYTTHNLAVLIAQGGVQSTRPYLDLAVEAARRCDRLLTLAQGQDRPLATVKDAAYAWRQALFFLVLADDQAGFEAALQPADWPMSEVLDSLRSGRPFLGWTTTRHWALRSRSTA